MTATQQSVLCMVKSAITGVCDPLPEDFSLKPVARLMQAQGLGAMCYIGAQHYGISSDDAVFARLQDSYCYCFIRSEQQLQQIDRIFAAFEENKIDYMPVKGSIMKALYPDHAMRTMGDADILIRNKEYQRIRPVMEALGFDEVCESDHEHIWYHPQLKVELHKRLIPSYNKDYYSYFGEGWDLAKVHMGGCRWAMTHEDAFIYDTIHFAKHYRDASANAHFLIDLWVHMRTYPDLDQEYIRAQMHRLRMDAFYDNILRVIDAWFEGGPWDDKIEHITNVLFNENAKQHKDNKVIAQDTRAVHNAGSVKKAKRNRFFRSLFPGKQAMIQTYPQWRNVPLPIAWVMRWFHTLFCRRDAIKRQLTEKHEINAQDVENYRQDLEYIGLQFSDQVVLPD